MAQMPNRPAHVTGDDGGGNGQVGVDGAIYISPFDTNMMPACARRRRTTRTGSRRSSQPRRSGAVADASRVEKDTGCGQHPHHHDRESAPDDPGQPDPGAPGSMISGQRSFWATLRGARSVRPSSRYALHHRPAWAPPTGGRRRAAALGRPSESCGTRQAKCSDQDHRRLHTVKGAVSVPRHWDPLARILMPGFDRCLWGTDGTRAFAVVNYEQAVEPFLKTTA